MSPTSEYFNKLLENIGIIFGILDEKFLFQGLNWAACNCSRNSTIIVHPFDQTINYDSILEYSPFKGDDPRGLHHRRHRQRTGDRPSSSRSKNKIEKELICLGKV